MGTVMVTLTVMVMVGMFDGGDGDDKVLFGRDGGTHAEEREQADIYDSWCAVMNGHDGDGEDDCHDMVTEMMVTVTMLKVIAVVTMGLDADICVYG